MKRPSFFLCLLPLAALLGLPQRARAIVARPAVPLSIGILLHQRSVQIGSTRGFRVAEAGSGQAVDTRWGGERATVGGWLAGLRYEGRSNHQRLTVYPTAGGFLTVNGKAYRGLLDLQQDRQGGINVVNCVDIESYLYGVVKAEMSALAPLEALKAQAIAARTFALKGRDTFKAKGYGLKANEQSQVYGGVSMEDPRTTRAVDETRGIVITYDGEPIEALFHAACGGRTENNEDVWGSPPMAYERAVVCPGCRRSSTVWHASVDYGFVAQRLRKFKWNVGEIYRITPTYTRTGRVRDVIIHSSTGIARVPGNNFRIIVNRHAIRSLWWVSGPGGGAQSSAGGAPSDGPDDDQSLSGSEAAEGTGASPTQDVAIRSIIGRYIQTNPASRVLRLAGKGWGHGVGLCQWGAKMLATSGRSYQEIVRCYYTGVGFARAY